MLHAIGNYRIKRNFDVPLTYLICALAFKIFGVSIQSTKIVALAFGTFTPINIYHNQALDYF